MAIHFSLMSAAFDSGDGISERYTCEGDDVSPPLRWHNPPEGTRSFVVIADDPDAKAQTFTHWIVFNIPADRDTLPENLDLDRHFTDGARPAFGVNDFGDIGYGGPCPPSGDGPHRYFFRLFALDTELELSEGTTRHQVTQAMNGHILGEADIMGRFARNA